MIHSILAVPTIAAALTLCASPVAGQFAEGDLLVRYVASSSSPDVLYRIDPTTGVGDVLMENMFAGYSAAGSVVYDSYRDGVLAYTAYKPYGPFDPRLFLIRADGSFADLGFLLEALTALAPVGDGRVYLLKGGVLNVLDAANRMVEVPDHQGDPLAVDAAHLIYDPTTNSLIGVTRMNIGACSSSSEVSLLRYPLTVEGDELSGPIACVGLAVGSTAPVGLDYLPGGQLLLTFADRIQGRTNSLRSIDPTTLGVAIWATPNYADVDGGTWCPALGRAVILNDRDNDLRSFAQGEVGLGSLLVSSVPVSSGATGTGTKNRMSDVNFLSSPCTGLVREYGAGLAGKGGRVPSIGAATCPAIGTILPLTVTNAVGGTTAIVAFGLGSTSLPVLGGVLLVAQPFFATRTVSLGGFSGASGDGFGQANILIPNDPLLIGLPFFVQAAVQDTAAVQGWSLTQGLELRAQ